MSFSVARDVQQVAGVPALHELKQQLQTSDLERKAEVMESLLTYYRADRALSGALMHVIRYVSGYSKDHTLAKLTNLFWESLPCQDSELTLLVSQILRNELQSSNEYMRGACLRNLAKGCHLEILKTVADVIVANLEHSHPYVRRNACLAIAAINQRYPGHFDDAVPTIVSLALTDRDRSTQQHAMHAVGVLDMAAAYKTFIRDGVKARCAAANPEVYDCGVIELVRDCWQRTKAFPPPLDLVDLVERDVLLAALMAILESTASNTVRLSAVTCLLWMSSREDHMREAALACVAILNTHTNLDVKYHVVGIIEQISGAHASVIETIALDLLRLVSVDSAISVTPELAQQIIKLAVPVVNDAHVRAAVELLQTRLTGRAKKDEMQSLLLRGLRQLCARFPSVAVSVMDTLIDFLGDCESTEVVALLRELLVCCAIDEATRERIILRLIDSVGEIKSAQVLCQGLYLIGQFASTTNCKAAFVSRLTEALEPMPFPELSDENAAGDLSPNAKAAQSKIVVKTVVLADGSYGTQNVLVDEEKKVFAMRQCIFEGRSTNLLSVLAVAVVKVLLRATPPTGAPVDEKLLYHRAMLILASLYKMARENPMLGEKNCTRQRVEKCLRVICNCYRANKRISDDGASRLFLDAVVNQREITDGEEAACERTCETHCAVDDKIHFFPSYEGLAQLSPEASREQSVQGLRKPQGTLDSSRLLSAVEGVPLSGMSDPVCVEAFVRMNHMDVILELFLVNRLSETLTNVSVNIGTHGDSMRILETSSSEGITLAPSGGAGTISTTIRLSSTDAGLIHGFCTFNRGVHKTHFPLAELQIDLLDCLEESYIGSASFQRLWADFEWENKIAISLRVGAGTAAAKCLEFVALLLEKTKMKMTAESGLSARDLETMAASGVFALNFCTRSIFDEDALVNLSLDLKTQGAIFGTARIRSRTQGIALSLGDRIAQTQRAFAARC